MATYFPDEVQTTPTYFPDEILLENSPAHSERMQRRTALFAAFANREGLFDAETLSQAVDRYTTELGMGREDQVRSQISTNVSTERMATMSALQNEYLRDSSTFPEGVTLNSLIQHQIQGSTNINPNALEWEGIGGMIDSSGVEPTQGAIVQQRIDSGELDRSHADLYKAALFERAMDAIEIQQEDQGLFSKITDFFTVPLNVFQAHLGVVPGERSTSWNPVINLRTEIESLFSKPLPEFERDLPALIQNVRDQSGWFGENLSLASQVLNTYRSGLAYGAGSSFLMEGVIDATGAVDLIPVTALSRLIRRTPALAVAVGNRNGAAQAVANTIVADANNLGSRGNPYATVIEGVEAVYEALPNSVKPAPNRTPYIGLGGTVGHQINEIAAIAGTVRKGVVDRLTPEQLEVAVAATRREMAENISGNEIYDITAPSTHWSINATRVADEHADELRQLETEALARVGTKPPTVPASSTTYTGKNGKTFNADQVANMTNREIRSNFGYNATEARLFRNQAALHQEEVIIRQEPVVPESNVSYTGQSGNTFRAEDVARMTQKQILQEFGLRGLEARLLRQRAALSLEEVRTRIPDTPKITRVATDNVGSFVRRLNVNEPELDRLIRQSNDAESNLTRLHMYLGRPDGEGGWMDLQAAVDAANRKGLGGFRIVKNMDGQHFIEVTRNVVETGVSLPSGTAVDDIPGISLGAFSSWAKNPLEILSDRMAGARQTVTLERSNIWEHMIKPISLHIRALSRREFRALRDVLERGRTQVGRDGISEGIWYTPDELKVQYENIHGRLPSDKETVAYYAYKELSDLDFNIRDTYIYTEKARRGVMTGRASNPALGFDTGRVNMTEAKSVDIDDFVLDVETGEFKRLGQTGLDKYNTGNYRVVDLESPFRLAFGREYAKRLLVHKQSSELGPLSKRQLNYVEGGHREPTSKYFVKQAAKFVKDGVTIYLNDLTHVAGRTQKSLVKWADDMNRARLVWNDPDSTMEDLIRAAEQSPVESYKNFKQMWDDEVISHDTPFEIVFDRAATRERSGIGVRPGVQSWADDAMSPDEHYAISSGRMYYSHRKSKALRGPDDLRADVLDPWKTLSKSLGNIVRTKALYDYNTSFIEDWVRLARETNMIDSAQWSGKSPSDVFFNSTLRPGSSRVDQELYQKLEANRAVHRRFMGFKTDQMSTAEMGIRRLAEYIDGHGTIRSRAAASVLNIADSNPLEAIRAYTYHTTLGMGDVGQFIIQTQQAILATVAAGPVDGYRAWANSRAMLHMMINRSDNVMDMYAQRLYSHTGFDSPDEYKTFIKSWRDSGWSIVSGEQIELDRYTNSVGGSGLRRVTNNVLDIGLIPLRYAEKVNRYIAFDLGWKQVKKKNPNLAVGTKEFLHQVNLEASNFNVAMTNASRSGWQHGLWSLPMQFMSWPIRFMELMLPKTLGGSKRLSGAQKGRLWAGSALLYGAAGIPGMGIDLYGVGKPEERVADAYEWMTGEQMSDTSYRLLTKGLIDQLMFSISSGDADTDWASRAGVGEGISDFVNKMFSGDLASMYEVATGAAGTSVSDMGEALNTMYRLAKAEQTGYLNEQQWGQIGTELIQQVSSMSRMQRAYWIWSTGHTKNPDTGQFVMPATEMEGYLALLGVPLAGETILWDTIFDDRFRAERVRSLAELLAKNRRAAMEAMNRGGSEEALKFELIASGLTMAVHGDGNLQDEVVKAVNSQLKWNNSMYWETMNNYANSRGTLPRGANEDRLNGQ